MFTFMAEVPTAMLALLSQGEIGTLYIYDMLALLSQGEFHWSHDGCY
jgi:hypothetical protein